MVPAEVGHLMAEVALERRLSPNPLTHLKKIGVMVIHQIFFRPGEFTAD